MPTKASKHAAESDDVERVGRKRPPTAKLAGRLANASELAAETDDVEREGKKRPTTTRLASTPTEGRSNGEGARTLDYTALCPRLAEHLRPVLFELPQVARPQNVSRGRVSYTVKFGKARIEVRLLEVSFYLRRNAQGWVQEKAFAWKRYGGCDNAWNLALRAACVEAASSHLSC
eukprot:TRINITY_DN44303_c0_g1_i1.p2 TRINITY_DN44303_c0_g1~~TRINITY_DN44303_c0_g1_i1.p2  ORF type:complete len:175 (+),score=21.77 TRINITY_DN44303_c0_g1_i1:338-862(+)